MLLAIDPGEVTGWALFGDAGALVGCGLGHPDPDLLRPGMDVLIEVPRARPSDPNPQSLIVLALKAGEWRGRYGGKYVTPNDWKGSTPKQISHARILAKLDATERGVLDKATKGVALGKVHNIIDAIGIGLHGVGRRA